MSKPWHLHHKENTTIINANQLLCPLDHQDDTDVFLTFIAAGQEADWRGKIGPWRLFVFCFSHFKLWWDWLPWTATFNLPTVNWQTHRETLFMDSETEDSLPPWTQVWNDSWLWSLQDWTKRKCSTWDLVEPVVLVAVVVFSVRRVCFRSQLFNLSFTVVSGLEGWRRNRSEVNIEMDEIESVWRYQLRNLIHSGSHWSQITSRSASSWRCHVWPQITLHRFHLA